MSNAPNALRIYVTRDRIMKRGPIYTARLHSADGEVVATGSMEPALGAARALIARGFDPSSILEMWDDVRPYPRLRGTLGKMARQTVKEEAAASALRFVPYVAVQDRFSHGIETPKQGLPASGATDMPQAALSSPATHREAA